MTASAIDRCRGRNLVRNEFKDDILVGVTQTMHEQCRGCARYNPGSLQLVTEPAPVFTEACPRRVERGNEHG